MAKVFEITDKKYEPGHEPLVCNLVSCENELTGQQRKYCSEKCRAIVMSAKACKERKGVYKSLDWAGGPRGIVSESSIRKNETHVTGNGEFVVDDYHVDPDIFAIAEANHEQYVLDRNEYEARVVIDGLTIFQEEYDKHHDVSYSSEQAKKHEANLTEDQKKIRSIKNKKYQQENKERISKQARERYRANPEKYRKIHNTYYHKNKDKIKKFHRKYYRENVRKPDLFMFEQWLKKRTSGS
jgi:hypothetical protein|tara:strand:- start:4033 stop:4752 length:720 start_codon:yes stop_codon:yes gene_type:complete